MSSESAARARALAKDVTAIRKEYRDSANVAFREAVQERLKEEFCQRFALTVGNGARVMRLISTKEDPYAASQPSPVPGCDHPEMYNHRGRPAVFVFHTYNEVQTTALDDFCERSGLEWKILPASWHYVGWATAVAIWAKGKSPLRRD